MSVWGIISLTLALAYASLLLIYFVAWLFIPTQKKPFGLEPKQRFSIIIPARNEAKSIITCLNAIIQQDYPTDCYEVIVIDDFSTDETAVLVQTYMAENKLFPIQLLQAKLLQTKGKKACITAAIARAKFDFICLTDADCTRGKEWLKAINCLVQKKATQMIYGPVFFSANNLFEQSQTLEFMGLVGIGAAAIQLKNPNMCSAANLIFKKSAFYEIGGYAGNENIASGDDEFLLHKIFKLYPNEVFFMKDHRAIVETSPNSSMEELAQQRRRWVSKSTKYDNRYITAILVGAYFFNFSMFWNALAGFFMPGLWVIFGLQIGLKILAEGLLILAVLRFFKQSKLILLLPWVEPFHILYVLIIGIWANIQTFTWKERKLQ
jgi:cellulose synthase/poly-beta-1,6-N-acetylglucosamine synthase-like glycosyltransferase